MLIKLSTAGNRVDYDPTSLSEPDPNDEFDMWLEPFDIDTTSVSGSVSVKRMPTGGTGLRRASSGPTSKNASTDGWDEDFQNAKAHAASVLKHFLQ